MTRLASKPSQQSRLGFSLVELIVVLAIIAMLLALGLPAIQQMRQSARNAECKNHLKQLVLGVHNHQTQSGFLPKDNVNGWGYAAYLLPQLELSSLFQRLNPLQSSLASGAVVKPGVTDTVIAVYLCPSLLKEPNLTTGFGRLCFLANSELMNRKKRQLSDVADGESQTILVGETQNDAAWAMSASATGDAVPNQGAFGSRHGGGANFGLCDGAVRWISESIDGAVFQALFTIAASDSVGDF